MVYPCFCPSLSQLVPARLCYLPLSSWSDLWEDTGGKDKPSQSSREQRQLNSCSCFPISPTSSNGLCQAKWNICLVLYSFKTCMQNSFFLSFKAIFKCLELNKYMCLEWIFTRFCLQSRRIRHYPQEAWFSGILPLSFQLCIFLWSLVPKTSQKVPPLQLKELLRSQFLSGATQRQGLAWAKAMSIKPGRALHEAALP